MMDDDPGRRFLAGLESAHLRVQKGQAASQIRESIVNPGLMVKSRLNMHLPWLNLSKMVFMKALSS